MEIVVYVLPALCVFAAPSLAWFLVLRRWAPREGSLLHQAKRSALVRLILVGIVTAVEALLLAILAIEPGYDAPEPGHQFGPKVESWRTMMTMSALLALLVTVVVLLVLVGVFAWEIGVAVKALLAVRSTRGAVPEPAPAEARADVDFGMGDEWLAHRADAPSTVYRGDAPATGWVRGRPMRGRFWVGPIITVFAIATAFLFLGTTALLSMGD